MKIEDWSSYDRSQYFNGAYVLVRLDGERAVARIEEFHHRTCTVLVDEQRISIPIEDILWDGLSPRRCVTFNGSLYFIAPLGARTTRKPITRGNLGAISISTNGQRHMSDADLNQRVIDAYLLGSKYPDTVDQAIFAVNNNTCTALTPHLGYIQCRIDRSNYFRIYRDSVKIFSCDDHGKVVDYLMENWETIRDE